MPRVVGLAQRDRANHGSASPVTHARSGLVIATIQATPNPTGAQSSYLNTLNGVSCTSATACSAAGSYVNSAGTAVTLAERYGQ